MGKIYNRSKHKDNRRILRNHPTRSESFLWGYLRRDQLGVRFRRQFGIASYIADFYCPKLKLVIELDGDSHDSVEQRLYDERRDTYMKNMGISVLRFLDGEVLEAIEDVLKKIKAEIQRLGNDSSQV